MKDKNGGLYQALTQALRICNRRIVEEAHAAGFKKFTPAHAQVLLGLEPEGTRVGAIAERAGFSRQAASQLVAEIEANGWIECGASLEDARAVVVRLTPKGKKLRQSIGGVARRLEERVGKREVAALRAALAAFE